MNAIAKEFLRVHLTAALRYFIVTAICAAVMLFTGTYAGDTLRIPAIAVTAFLGAITLWVLFDTLTAPRRFKARILALPESERGAIENGVQNARRLGRRWFLEEHLIYFAKRRIRFFRFDELCSAELNRGRLTVTLQSGEKYPFPYEADENPAVLVAVLRSRNSKLTAAVDGKPVNFDNFDSDKKKR